jgi:outer membrane protein assembly factor BamB
LPAQWSKTDRVLWATPLPGKSGATPIVWQDLVFLPSPDPEKNLWFLCLDHRTGAVKWRHLAARGDMIRAKNNLATPSAVTDGKRVIGLFGTGDLVAFDLEGTLLWQRNLAREFGGLALMFLYGNSPLLWQDRLYIQVLQRNPPTYPQAIDDQPARESFILCVDPGTGRTLWRQLRPTDAREEAMECYTTPVPYPEVNSTQFIVVGADCVTGHRLDSGVELWRFAGLNLKKNPGGRIVPSAVVVSNLVFACGPKREMLVAVRGGPEGQAGPPATAWKTTEFVPDVSTPLYYQNHLHVLDGDRQVMTCYEPSSGDILWQGKLAIREIFSASPTGADGRIYCLSEEGTVVVLAAGDQFEVIATVSMGEGPCLSSIAVAGGHLFIRTAKNLYCVGEAPRTPSIQNVPTPEPAVFENSLGMRFRSFPGTRLMVSQWETRVRDYEAFVGATQRSWSRPAFAQTPNHPAVNVNWDDARSFCEWLTRRERDSSRITAKQRYRLPTDEEWSLAAGVETDQGDVPQERMENSQVWPWGATWPPVANSGNYAQALGIDDFTATSPVGSFKPNRHGLYDLGGNVWEWCENWFNTAQVSKVLRGASWNDHQPTYLLSTYRFQGTMNLTGEDIGFRVIFESGP